MGERVSVIETKSAHGNIMRYELNRTLSSQGHVTYRPGDNIVGTESLAELSRLLFERGGIDSVHGFGSVLTLSLSNSDSSGIKEIIEDLFTYYKPGVEPPSFDA